MYSKVRSRRLMSNMKNAPLIYTLGMIQFPHVPDIERFIDSFRELIRRDYPEYDQSTTKTLNVSIDSDGIQLEEPQEAKIWQFPTVDRKWAFIITNQALFLHTSNPI